MGLVLAALFVVKAAANHVFAQNANVAEANGGKIVQVTKNIATLSTEIGVTMRVRRGKKLRLIRTQGERLRVETDQGDKKMSSGGSARIKHYFWSNLFYGFRAKMQHFGPFNLQGVFGENRKPNLTPIARSMAVNEENLECRVAIRLSPIEEIEMGTI